MFSEEGKNDQESFSKVGRDSRSNSSYIGKKNMAKATNRDSIYERSGAHQDLESGCKDQCVTF